MRFGKWFGRSETGDDIEQELQSHIQHRADDLESSGLDRAEAERRARIEFGGHGRFKEECQEAMSGTFVETMAQDARFSLRVLRKSPGFTIVAVLTLALAIGANAVVFGVLNALMLRPLHSPRAASLYQLERGPMKSPRQSYADYLDLRDRNHTFADLITYDIAEAALDTGASTARVWLELPSGNYFDDLGVQPYLGRYFHPADEHGPNSVPYVVLSYSYWHAHFQNDRTVVGRVINLNKHPFTIAGVTPPEFHDPFLFAFPDFWMPIVDQEQIEAEKYLDARGNHQLLLMMGHLKTGVTTAQAIADLNSVGAYLQKAYPKDEVQMNFTLARPSLMGAFLGPPIRAFVTGLMLLAGLILLAACANLGGLFAARAADRAREVALRLALGASWGRILRQLLTEAVLISLVGGTAGLSGSVALLRALSTWQPIPKFPLHVPVNPDATVYAVALILTLVSGLLFGAVPVRQVMRADPYQIVKAGSTATMGRRVTVRDVLLVAQIAVCAVLVTCSMVAVRGLLRSLHGGFGFEPQGVLLGDADLSMVGYSGDSVAAMQRRMIDSVKQIPEVESVGLVDWAPLGGEGWRGALVFTDRTMDLRPANAAAGPTMFKISPEYFHAARTRLLAGRDVSWHDDAQAPRVAVINREFARKVFGSVTSAVGGYFKMRDGTRIQVVGVVEDGKYNSITEDQDTAMFLPLRQWPSTQASLVIRYLRDPQQLAAEVRAAVRKVDAGLPVSILTWTRQMDLTLFPSRAATVSLGILGVMGAMLAVTGIFGMAAYSISKRLKELGIRMAIGAQRWQILQTALGRAIKLLALGSGAGLVLGLLATRVLAAIVYQATPRDPLVLAGVVLAMASLGLLATWIPAQRALGADPKILLREE